MNHSTNCLYHQIILASSSPQRSAILREYGFHFVVQPSHIDEIMNPKLSPEENAESLAIQKAKALPPQKHGNIILAADTLVVDENNSIYGKPKNREDAQHMLENKCGKTEKVITGFCLISDEHLVSGNETSYVEYNDFCSQDVTNILHSGEWEHVAGALRIEGKAMEKIIKRITGDYQNIIGLPIGRISHILRDFPVGKKLS